MTSFNSVESMAQSDSGKTASNRDYADVVKSATVDRFSAFTCIQSVGDATGFSATPSSPFTPGMTSSNALYPTPVFPFPELPISSVAFVFPRRRRKENQQRRQRTTFTADQTLKLELEFQKAEYITRPRRYELAELLALSETQIKIWFQNRRAKDKRIEKAHMDRHIRVFGDNQPMASSPFYNYYSKTMTQLTSSSTARNCYNC